MFVDGKFRAYDYDLSVMIKERAELTCKSYATYSASVSIMSYVTASGLEHLSSLE